MQQEGRVAGVGRQNDQVSRPALSSVGGSDQISSGCIGGSASVSGRMSDTDLHSGDVGLGRGRGRNNGNQGQGGYDRENNHVGGDFHIAGLSLSPNSAKDSQQSPHAKKFTRGNDEDCLIQDPFHLGIVRPVK